MATPSQQEQTAYHEAGHFVIARAVQDESAYLPTVVSIEPHGETLGHCGGAEGCQENEEDVLVSYAGHVALARLLSRPTSIEEAGACRDYEEAEAVIDTLATTDAERNDLRTRLAAKTRDLVDEHWEEIHIVALALLEWETVSDDEADMLCDLAAGRCSVEDVVRYLCLAGRCHADAHGRVPIPTCIERWTNRPH